MPKELQENTVDHYAAFYPEYCRDSVRAALVKVLKKYGSLDAVTVDYFLKPQSCGGLGMGTTQYDFDLAEMS